MASENPDVDDIAGLLDQCSQDELENILQAIECGSLNQQSAEVIGDDITPVAIDGYYSNPAVSKPQPLPPSSPPPSNLNRRPVPAGMKRSGDAADEEREQTLSEAKRLLDSHSKSVASEVCKFMPCNSAGEVIDVDTLTQVLAARDEEVKDLELKLINIQAELSGKDHHVADLGSELDLAIREVRHRQLDLEFQQLKLEEMVRSNTDMEQAKKQLAARVDEAGLNARHAALDIDMAGRMVAGLVRVQGSLPWTVRKSRLMNGPGISERA
jgi:hypothetical protein